MAVRSVTHMISLSSILETSDPTWNLWPKTSNYFPFQPSLTIYIPELLVAVVGGWGLVVKVRLIASNLAAAFDQHTVPCFLRSIVVCIVPIKGVTGPEWV